MSKDRHIRGGGPSAAPLNDLPKGATIYSIMSGWASILQRVYKAPGVWHVVTNTYANNTAPNTVLTGAIKRTQSELGHLRLDPKDFDLATSPSESGERYTLYLRYKGSVTPEGEEAIEMPEGDSLAEYVENLDPDSDEFAAITSTTVEK